MGHIVTAPLVVTKGETGSDLYLYQGTQVPEFVKVDELKRLEEAGLIASDEAEKKTAKSAAAK